MLRRGGVVRWKRGISQLVQVPAIFTGLLASLWLWKCMTLVVFQKKIIFMPYIGRHERIEDYATYGVTWREHRIRSGRHEIVLSSSPETKSGRTMVYLQGNASSTPPRLPHLSKLILALRGADLSTQIWTVSYRGYWKSSGRPSEDHCLEDIVAAIEYIKPGKDIILYGHSIGAGLAVLSAHLLPHSALILETPFTSTMSLLKHIYPQKWLPYRYLGQFLRTRLDMEQSKVKTNAIFIIQAQHDEIVPASETAAVVKLLQDRGLDPVHCVVPALHMDAITKSQTRDAIVSFMRGLKST